MSENKFNYQNFKKYFNIFENTEPMDDWTNDCPKALINDAARPPTGYDYLPGVTERKRSTFDIEKKIVPTIPSFSILVKYYVRKIKEKVIEKIKNF